MKIMIEINDKVVDVIKSVFTKRNAITGIVVLFFIGGVFVFSQAITKPHDFSTGEVISAEEMNENFNALYAKVNELDEEIITANSFGDWDDTRAFDTVYQAETDGFVIGHCSGEDDNFSAYYICYTDNNVFPITQRCKEQVRRQNNISYHSMGNFIMPVRKDEYWRVTAQRSGTIYDSLYWLPLGI